MSEQIQSILEAVRGMDAEQRRELTAALATVDVSWPAAPSGRRQLVESIRGKYRHVPTSSEAFMNRKKEETVRESK